MTTLTQTAAPVKTITIKAIPYTITPIPIAPELGTVAYQLAKVEEHIGQPYPADERPTYVVHRDRSGRVVCECGDWIWRCQDQGIGATCKHGRSLIEAGLIAAPGRVIHCHHHGAGLTSRVPENAPRNAEEAEGWREYAVWSASLPAVSDGSATQHAAAGAASEATVDDEPSADAAPLPADEPPAESFAEEVIDAIAEADRRWTSEHPVNPDDWHVTPEIEDADLFMAGFAEIDPAEWARTCEERYHLPSREEPWW
jgi:hypothetical protein